MGRIVGSHVGLRVGAVLTPGPRHFKIIVQRVSFDY